MTRKAEVIIIGAGIIGAAIALELARNGYKTLNIDKLPAAGYGSTSNSSACVRFHYSTWDGSAIAFESYHYWKRWEDYLDVGDERGFARYVETGCLVLDYPSIKLPILLADVGVDFEYWDIETLRKNIPIYSEFDFSPTKRPDDDRFFDPPERKLSRVLFTPSGGYLNDPQLATHNLQRAAEEKGSKFLFNTEVVEIRRKELQVLGVTLKNGERIDAPVVVNAAGPHSSVVNRMAGVEQGMNIKTRALRQEVHNVPSPVGFDFEKNGLVTSDFTTATYHRPEVGNTILVGSQDPECDPRIWVEHPDNFNRQTTTAQWKAQVYRLAQRIPNLPIPNKPSGIVDLYDVSDDWIPIYDRSDLEGFYLAIGTSGNQFKNAPVVGKLMAELIHACENGHDHDTDAVKIACRHTGHVLNLGFYSRLREIRSESSFSVTG
ncbi:MAG: FAD-binding oxidoreductase [Deltaproteobacteria bacterium]|nr:MAG: FAD-binding oxidoreductase [Deltaproteobacteria bacterium]